MRVCIGNRATTGNITWAMVIFGVPVGYEKASPELDFVLEFNTVICDFGFSAITALSKV